MNYTWDLTKIFKDENEYNNTINRVNELLKEIVKYKGKILENDNTFLEVLKLSDEIDLLTEKLYVYTYLEYYDNMGDVKFQKYKEEVNALCDKTSSETTFMNPELLSNDFKIVEEYINKNNKLEKYRKSMEQLFRFKPFILSEKEEKILSDASEILKLAKTTYEVIDNIDIKFDKIKDENGKKVELNSSNYSVFLSSKDKKVRKNAFKSQYKYYEDHINTISSLYIGKVKTNKFITNTRGYKDILDLYLYPDNIDEKLFKNLIKINNKNIPYLKEYYKFKNEQLGYKMHMYDTYVNIAKVPEINIEYEDAIKLVNKALKPLGEEYLKTFNHLLENRCVDVFPKSKKRSGAYEWGCFGVEPYVSLNYEKNIDSVSTLAHEMGHAMHTYYSNTNQDYLYANYPIFLAEIASTVNEVLLSNYLINNTNNKDEKMYYLVEFLDKFKATVYRQVMFSEFEYNIHKMYEKGEFLTKDLLCETYYKLNKKNFSGSVIVDKEIQYEWARIPHFYTSFYVYKYATGFISALIIADKLEHDSSFKDKYIKFLSSGSSLYPLELLNTLGIDISSEETLNKAYELFNEKLILLKNIGKE